MAADRRAAQPVPGALRASGGAVLTAGVLLAVGDEALARQIDALARRSADMVVTDRVGAPDALLRAVMAPDVDVVVLDETFARGGALEVARELTSLVPEIGLVLAAPDRGDGLLAAALHAGFRGVVGVPVGPRELAEAVAAAASWARTVRPRMAAPGGGDGRRGIGTTLALVGGKGGTGTTTLAVHLGLAVMGASPSRSVCLVDLDLPMGDLRGLLGLPDLRSLGDLLDGPLTPERVDDDLALHASGLRALVLPADPDRAERADPDRVRAVLAHLRTRFDVVVTDLGAGCTDVAHAAAEIADRVAVVVTPDVPAVRGANRLLARWDRRGVRAGPVAAVLNRASRDGDVQPAFVAQALAAPLLAATVPADHRALATAANTGVTDHVPDGPWRQAVARLAGDLELLPQQRRTRNPRRALREALTPEPGPHTDLHSRV